MAYNNNFFNFNGNAYYTPTSFLDITNPDIITLTNLVCRIGLIRINITHAPNLMTIIFKIILTLHRVNGDSPPLSQIFNHLVHNFHSPIWIHILLFLFHQPKKNLMCHALYHLLKPSISDGQLSLRGLTPLLGFPPLEVSNCQFILEFSPLGVDACNLTMGDTPTSELFPSCK